MMSPQKLPQFQNGGPLVLVRNTFLDLDDRPPMEDELKRAKTAPPAATIAVGCKPEPEPKESEEDRYPDSPLSMEIEQTKEDDNHGPAETPEVEELRRFTTENWFEPHQEWVWAGDSMKDASLVDVEMPRSCMLQQNMVQCTDPMMGNMGSMQMPVAMQQSQQIQGPGLQVVLMPVTMAPIGGGAAVPADTGTSGLPPMPPQVPEMLSRQPNRGARWPTHMPATPGLQNGEIQQPFRAGRLTEPASVGAPGSLAVMPGGYDKPLEEGAVAGSSATAQPQTLTRHVSAQSGCSRVHWTVDARKLKGNDKQAVSPPFELSFGNQHPDVTFKMMIYPKSTSDTKGGASFKRSKGHGFVQLKCEAELSHALANVSFRISIGSQEKQQPFRGPVSHNFSKNAVCGLPKETEEWDFSTVVDPDSQTFVVCLEIVPL
eukprot:TRINITY_DN94711_c0_g1_i1.p1 TRINITY_DN94711_c0_g1~~TRINITY_DN94711_c0_g1_i1.p1  ORF type:complete len:430 (+),score=88.61 TRINITY_DN94711_c0_g1_i1:62-1351(+)